MKLKEIGTGQGWGKVGILGFAKSGKTYTAVEIALGLRKQMKHDGPICMYDTEGGVEYINPRVKKETGRNILGIKSRSFDDLMSFGAACEKQGGIIIVDSITHPWRELCEAHLAKVNASRKAMKIKPRQRLEFQDWNVIKPLWAKWTDFYLNSPLHIIICGRAGYEWDFTDPDEETGKRELIKSGVKMKTETEFGFEPSLLVEMERIQKAETPPKIYHRATVIGDRFNVIDGEMIDNPTYEFFKPHFDCLCPGQHNKIDTRLKTKTGADEEGLNDAARLRRKREILCEEIQGELLKRWPSQKVEDKTAKLEAIDRLFGTRSWTKVEQEIPAEKLKEGLIELRGIISVEPDCKNYPEIDEGKK